MQTHIANALKLISHNLTRCPQHPEHIQAATDLLASATSLEDLHARLEAAGHGAEVWTIAATAWHLAHGRAHAAQD